MKMMLGFSGLDALFFEKTACILTKAKKAKKIIIKDLDFMIKFFLNNYLQYINSRLI
jgi:hypothetical protein